MLSTVLVIGGVLVGLLVLLTVIVALSSRGRGSTTAARTGTRTPSWVVDSGKPHPETWGPLSTTSTEIRAIR